jgi:hypothetical protein
MAPCRGRNGSRKSDAITEGTDSILSAIILNLNLNSFCTSFAFSAGYHFKATPLPDTNTCAISFESEASQ